MISVPMRRGRTRNNIILLLLVLVSRPKRAVQCALVD